MNGNLIFRSMIKTSHIPELFRATETLRASHKLRRMFFVVVQDWLSNFLVFLVLEILIENSAILWKPAKDDSRYEMHLTLIR